MTLRSPIWIVGSSHLRQVRAGFQKFFGHLPCWYSFHWNGVFLGISNSFQEVVDLRRWVVCVRQTWSSDTKAKVARRWRMWSRSSPGLDLDGSGVIDYTEFCAAGIGESISLEARNGRNGAVVVKGDVYLFIVHTTMCIYIYIHIFDTNCILLQYGTVLIYTILYYILYTILYYTILYYIPYYTIYHTILYTILYYTITILYYTILYSTTLYSVMLYYMKYIVTYCLSVDSSPFLWLLLL